MNPWSFVLAAYVLALGASAVLALTCWRAMRAAEAAADAARRRR